MSVSVLILALNEEVNMRECLECVSWSDDVVVLDSGSTDKTVEIAKEYGARVIFRKLDDWSTHRQWAMKQIPFKYPWVLHVDADERVSPALADEARDIAANAPENVTLCMIGRKDYFLGKWIKRSSCYPVWLDRFYRPDRVWMNGRLVNEHLETDGEIHYLKEPFLHYPFSKGLHQWFERHNNYSSFEAAETITASSEGEFRFRDLFQRDPFKRRKALKELSMRIPCRPFAKFCYLYLVRRGFLDGKAGLTYCMMLGIYEYMIELKVREQRRRAQGLSI